MNRVHASPKSWILRAAQDPDGFWPLRRFGNRVSEPDVLFMRFNEISIFHQIFKFFVISTLTLEHPEIRPLNCLETLELRIWNYMSWIRFWQKLFEFHMVKSNFQKQNVSKFIKLSRCHHAANLSPAYTKLLVERRTRLYKPYSIKFNHHQRSISWPITKLNAHDHEIHKQWAGVNRARASPKSWILRAAPDPWKC